MGLFKKYVITLREFYFITSPVLFTKNNKLWNHRKEDFFCTYGCFSVSSYIKESKISHGHNRNVRYT